MKVYFYTPNDSFSSPKSHQNFLNCKIDNLQKFIMFITFEGIDGSGKTTQIRLLADYLKEIGREVVLIREPGGTNFSENIRELLLNSKHEISSVSELLLFNAARANLTENVIKPALEDGKIVLSDRFFDSTTAYQGYGRNLDIKMVENCNQIGSLGVLPFRTFYFDIKLSISSERSQNRKKDRIESSGNDFYEKVINGFRQIAIENPNRVVTIDASQSIMQIHTDIKNNLNL